jgi:CheY-like chemotaxis protein
MSHSLANRPVALLVEDKPELLKAKQNLFNVSGFQAICVRTAAEALREFIATPAVDIIVADLNLDSSNEQDLSGVDIAVTIREMRPDVPIVAVSGQIESLNAAQTQPFTDSLIKGKKLSLDDYDAMLTKWHEEAIAYRERRTTCSKRVVEALEAHSESPPVDYEVLREFLPGRQHTVEGQPRRACVTSPDEVLREAGWWLQLIQAGKTVGNGLKTASTRTQLAILVWLRKEDAEHVAVLHGFSFLSCKGPEPSEAVERLLKLMAAYHSGRMLLASDVNESERHRLLKHLNTIFEAAPSEP